MRSPSDRRVEQSEPLAEVLLDGQLLLELRLQLELLRVVAPLLLARRDERPPRAGLEAVDPVDRMRAARERERRGEELAAEAVRLELRRERVDAGDLVVELRVARRSPTRSRTHRSCGRSRSPGPSRCRARSSSASFSVDANSPAESGLKMSAESPAGVSEHSVWSVTAAVESANSLSAAGSLSFLRPKRMSPSGVRAAVSLGPGRRRPARLRQARLQQALLQQTLRRRSRRGSPSERRRCRPRP